MQIAFLHTAAEQEVNDLYAVHAQSVSVSGFDLQGPLEPRGVGETESRRRIFLCHPRARVGPGGLRETDHRQPGNPSLAWTGE